ncbi:MAG: hypothetical protein ACYC3X_30885 [Pirellulaceae bacterium]
MNRGSRKQRPAGNVAGLPEYLYVIVSPNSDVLTEYLPEHLVALLPEKLRRLLGPDQNGPATVGFRTEADAKRYLKTKPPGWKISRLPTRGICHEGPRNNVPAILIRNPDRDQVVVCRADGNSTEEEAQTARTRKVITKERADPEKTIAFERDGLGCRLLIPANFVEGAGLAGKRVALELRLDWPESNKRLGFVENDRGQVLLHHDEDKRRMVFTMRNCPPDFEKLNDGDCLECNITLSCISF